MTFYPIFVMTDFLIEYINAKRLRNNYLIRFALFSLLFVNLNYAFADDQVAADSQPQITNLNSSKVNNSKDQEDGKNNDSISNNANADSNVSSSNGSDVNSNNSANSSSSGVNDSNDTSNTNIRTEEIDNLVASMARAINSRDSSSIASFFHYYAVKDAEFIKKSYLYASNSASSALTATNSNKDNGAGNPDNRTAKTNNSSTDSAGSDNSDAQKPIAQEDLKMNLEQYIKYWYDISSNPADYSISISVNNINIENPQYATATIEIREMSTQKFDKAVTSDKNQKSPDVVKEVLKVVAYSTCNMTFIYNGITSISGMNCIENIAYNIE